MAKQYCLSKVGKQYCCKHGVWLANLWIDYSLWLLWLFQRPNAFVNSPLPTFSIYCRAVRRYRLVWFAMLVRARLLCTLTWIACLVRCSPYLVSGMRLGLSPAFIPKSYLDISGKHRCRSQTVSVFKAYVKRHFYRWDIAQKMQVWMNDFLRANVRASAALWSLHEFD